MLFFAEGEFGIECLGRVSQVYRDDRPLMLAFSRFIHVFVL